MLEIVAPLPFSEPVKPEIGVCVTPVQLSVAPLTISKLFDALMSSVNSSLQVVISGLPSESESERLTIRDETLDVTAAELVPSAFTPRTETLKK
jgi:hypothetical protein